MGLLRAFNILNCKLWIFAKGTLWQATFPSDLGKKISFPWSISWNKYSGEHILGSILYYFCFLLKKKKKGGGVPAWLNRLRVQLSILAWSWSWGLWDWALRQGLHWVWSLLEIDSLSPSPHPTLCLSVCVCVCTLSLSKKINKANTADWKVMKTIIIWSMQFAITREKKTIS